ncbi:MAG: hypothetical protein HXX20_12210 [Chloroflexi bacterium]|nr:hypothetical protein [Chloroflexota bacterium]
MAKIRERLGRKDELSGYARVFGHPELGLLFSKTQACVISAGTELEKILVSKSPHSLKYNDFVERIPNLSKLSQPLLLLYDLPTIEKKKGDFLIVWPSKANGIVVEIKEGDTFDTKKSDGEKESLGFLAQHYSRILGIKVSYALSSFYVSTREQIKIGTKSRFDNEHALTGRELCSMIEVNYAEIVEARKADEKDNLNYFLDKMLDMPDIRKMIEAKLSTRNDND